MSLSEIPLRQRKAAQTRISILSALLPRLKERALEDIPVHELCREVGISSPTFFNYFDSKGAVLPYFVSLWSLGAHVAMHQAPPGLPRLYGFFDEVAAAMQRHPGVLNAIIGHQQRLMRQPEIVTIHRADRLLWYPETPATLEASPRTVPDLISSCIAEAAAAGALPATADHRLLARILLAIFFGVPTAESRTARVQVTLRAAVTAILRGFGARLP